MSTDTYHDFDPLAPTAEETEGLLDQAIASTSQGSGQTERGGYVPKQLLERGQNRVLAEVHRRFMEEARLAGETFYYGWGSGKNAIEGPSVKCAMSAARCWGNCSIENMPVQDTRDAWIFTARFIDYETGFTLERQFRQSKRWQVFGKHDEERKDDIRFQIGQSKAARNVILNVLPQWMIDQGMREAKNGVRKRIEAFVNKEGIAKATDMVIGGLVKAGVPEEIALGKVGVATKQGVDVEHLVILRGDLMAIQEGQEYPESLFPAMAQEDPPSKPDPGKSRAEQLAEQASGKKAATKKTASKKQEKPTEEPAEEPPAEEDAKPGYPDHALMHSLVETLEKCKTAEQCENAFGDLQAEAGCTEEMYHAGDALVEWRKKQLSKGKQKSLINE